MLKCIHDGYKIESVDTALRIQGQKLSPTDECSCWSFWNWCKNRPLSSGDIDIGICVSNQCFVVVSQTLVTSCFI